jgi:hypothetical protein
LALDTELPEIDRPSKAFRGTHRLAMIRRLLAETSTRAIRAKQVIDLDSMGLKGIIGRQVLRTVFGTKAWQWERNGGEQQIV